MKNVLMGAIVGDYMGSCYEFSNCHDYNFSVSPDRNEVTDDSVLTIAVADALLHNTPVTAAMRYWCSRYPSPMGGYGTRFLEWLASNDPKPYYSMGNGAAMRVSAAGWICDSLDDTLRLATRVTACTHNHEDGIRGAQAVAAAIFMLRHGESRAKVRDLLDRAFMLDMSKPLEEVRQSFRYTELCPPCVRVAALCYLESQSWEDAVRLAVSMGGDADTLGAIAGSIAMADPTYDIPQHLMLEAYNKLDKQQQSIVDEFKAYVGSREQGL